MGRMKAKTFAKELIVNRIESVKAYLRNDDLSLLDLCRLYQNSVHHPERVHDILKDLNGHLLDLDDTERQSELKKRGLVRIPSRFLKWNPGDRLEGDFETVFVEMLQTHGGKKLNLFLTELSKEGLLRGIEETKVKVYELYSIGFKNIHIKEYLGDEQKSSMTDVLLKTFEKMTPQTHSYEAYKLDADRAKASKNGDIKKSNPVRIADKAELRKLLDEGASLKEIIMITGDQSVVIEDYRDEQGLKTKKEGKTKTGRDRASYIYKKKNINREMFKAYIDEKNLEKTQTELAKDFGTTRVSFSKAIKEYLKEASPEEKEKYVKRMEASEQLRMDHIHSTRKSNNA